MCECAIHTTDKKHDWFGEKKYRLADFFDKWWDIYTQNPTSFIQPEQYKAVNAIRICRTAALGIDILLLPQCGDTTEIYHNCKNRFLPHLQLERYCPMGRENKEKHAQYASQTCSLYDTSPADTSDQKK